MGLTWKLLVLCIASTWKTWTSVSSENRPDSQILHYISRTGINRGQNNGMLNINGLSKMDRNGEKRTWHLMLGHELGKCMESIVLSGWQHWPSCILRENMVPNTQLGVSGPLEKKAVLTIVLSLCQGNAQKPPRRLARFKKKRQIFF